MNESHPGMPGRLGSGQAGLGQSTGQPARAVLPKATVAPIQEIPKLDNDPIELVGEDDVRPASMGSIRAFGVVGAAQATSQWKRKPYASGQGAIRVRTFHGKLSDQGMDHMDNVINTWLDNHPEVEVKNVTTSIGQFEGKIREPAIVVNVWY